MNKIDRIDLEPKNGRKFGTYGWQVRFQSTVNKVKNINRFFSDKKYGGSDLSYEAAKSFRDAMEKEYQPSYPGSLDAMRKTRNKSGLVGVHRTIYKCTKKYGTYYYPVWQAHFPIAKNKNKSVRYSINKFGDEEAKRLAIEARDRGVEKYRLNNRKLFKPPNDSSIKIWRYLDFTKFVSMLVNKGLYFPVANKFDDQFEGSFSIVNKKLRPMIHKELHVNYNEKQIGDFFLELKKWICISCWHINEFESAAMWKIYSSNSESICIQSTYEKLVQVLPKNIEIGLVNYVDYEKEWIPENDVLSPFLYKRKAFEHERELRAILNLSNKTNFNNLNFNKESAFYGKWINIDLQLLIENIFVSPNSPKCFFELVNNMIKLFKLKWEALPSTLMDKPYY